MSSLAPPVFPEMGRFVRSLDKLVADVLRALSPRPAAQEECTDAFAHFLAALTKVTKECELVALEIRKDIIEMEWEYALPFDLREQLLGVADRMDERAARFEARQIAEEGPLWAIAQQSIQSYNDTIRLLTRTVREAATTIRRAIADEVRDDEEAIAAFDAVDPEDPIVEPMLHA